MIKTDAPLNVKYLRTLVQCLSMLGKVAAAGAVIWYFSSYSFSVFLTEYALYLSQMVLIEIYCLTSSFQRTRSSLFILNPGKCLQILVVQ